ncbi:HGxxPAAW family protein [Streptomyces sp. DT2A-34]|uniref:HGxxPAAW family protein n=1 Tax=Streptomyces sp. DT2A-34 TaxID=3051182 RepID=UPI00265C10D7|nr:HGxxPAAW family protein [Streptomyces sp. DT2A-34]MDO0913612.1 HGxxPAAW family protein [Streptomyces sp. DT2A-34]
MSQYDEGHTVAGWTGTAIASVGAAVLGAGTCVVSAALMVGGLGILAASVLVTWALHLSGWGKPPGVRTRGQWRMGSRDLTARDGHADCWGCRLAGRGRRRTAVVASVVASDAASDVVVVTGDPEPAAAEAGR